MQDCQNAEECKRKLTFKPIIKMFGIWIGIGPAFCYNYNFQERSFFK